MLLDKGLSDVGRYLNNSVKNFDCVQLVDSYVKAKIVYDELYRINWPNHVNPLELNRIIYEGAKTVLFGSEEFDRVESENYQEGGFFVIMRANGTPRFGMFQRGDVGKEKGSSINMDPPILKEGERIIALFHSHPMYKFPFSSSLSNQYNAEVSRPFPSTKDMQAAISLVKDRRTDDNFVQYVGKLYKVDEKVEMKISATQYTNHATASLILNIYYNMRKDFIVWDMKINNETIQIGENGYPVLTDKKQTNLTSIETAKCNGIRKNYGKH